MNIIISDLSVLEGCTWKRYAWRKIARDFDAPRFSRMDVVPRELETRGDTVELDAREIEARELDAREQDAHGLHTRELDAPRLDARGLDARGLDARGIRAHGVNGRELYARGLDAHGLDARGLDWCDVLRHQDPQRGVEMCNTFNW